MTPRRDTDRAGGGDVLCVDLGATNVRAALVRGSETLGLVRRGVRDLLSPAGDIVGGLLALLDEVCERVGNGGRPLAVGVAVAGVVSVDGTVDGAAPFGLPAGHTVREALHEHFGVPVVVANDANTAALGEYTYGAGRGARSLLLLTLGTNLGLGMVLDGQMYAGAHGGAGEVGMAPVPCELDDEITRQVVAAYRREQREGLAPGRAGAVDMPLWPSCTAEEVYGGRALGLRRDILAGQANESWTRAADADVFSAAAAGDSTAQAVVSFAFRGWARILSHSSFLIDPDVIVLGGGMSPSLHPHLERFVAIARSTLPSPPPAIRIARLGDGAGLVGARVAARLSLDAGGGGR